MERIPCENQDVCPLRDTQRGCFEDVHHLYFPANAYRTPTQKRFRELPENKIVTCRNVHNTEHAVGEIPVMPDLEIMQMAVRQEKVKRKNGLV